MSAMVHANILLCSFNTLNSFFSIKLVKEEEIIIGKCEDPSKKIYFKWEEKGLSSRVGGSSIDSFGRGVDDLSNSSKRDLYAHRMYNLASNNRMYSICLSSSAEPSFDWIMQASIGSSNLFSMKYSWTNLSISSIQK